MVLPAAFCLANFEKLINQCNNYSYSTVSIEFSLAAERYSANFSFPTV